MTDDGKSPRRTFHAEGEEWIAEVTGKTRSGSGTDAGAPLLYIAFAPVRSPSTRVREGIAVSLSLDEISDHDLEVLFGRSRAPRGKGGGVSKGSGGQGRFLPHA